MVLTQLILNKSVSSGIILSVTEKIVTTQIPTKINISMTPSNQVIEGTQINIYAELVNMNDNVPIIGIFLHLLRNGVKVGSSQTNQDGVAGWEIITSLVDNGTTYSVVYLGGDKVSDESSSLNVL